MTVMAPTSSDWTHVAAALRARMDGRQLILADLARESGVSDTSLRKYLRGQPIHRQKVKWSIARALGWPSDAIDRLARGDTPDDTWEVHVGEPTTRISAEAAALVPVVEQLQELGLSDPAKSAALIAELVPHLQALAELSELTAERKLMSPADQADFEAHLTEMSTALREITEQLYRLTETP